MISVSEAQDLVRKNGLSLKTELISLENSLGRILAEEVRADRDYPPFNRSAMDGFALRSAEFHPDKVYEVVDTLFAGDFRERKYAEGEVIKIMTGAPVPEFFDAVIKVEDAEKTGERVSFSLNSVKAFENIARQGEDLKRGEVALQKGQRISPPEIALLASLGKSTLSVYKSPKVAVISTGDEVKAVGEPVLRHQIRNSNGPVLSAFFKRFGVEQVSSFLVDDKPEHLRAILQKALAYDMVVLSGGVSMGDADYVPETLLALGVGKIFHKVSLKPGKPVWFGRKLNGPVVFGLPGNPFSSQVTFKLFIEPLLRESFRLKPLQPVLFPSAFTREKKMGLDEFLPAVIIEEDGRSKVQLCFFNGSGDITATAMSEGLVVHPAGKDSVGKDEMLAFYPW